MAVTIVGLKLTKKFYVTVIHSRAQAKHFNEPLTEAIVRLLARLSKLGFAAIDKLILH